MTEVNYENSLLVMGGANFMAMNPVPRFQFLHLASQEGKRKEGLGKTIIVYGLNEGSSAIIVGARLMGVDVE